MKPLRHTTADLDTLVALFYPAPEDLAVFDEVTSGTLPPAFRQLLDHDEHMTVTVESFHGSLVDVEVLQTSVTPTHYARKILLRRRSDRQVVQFGIVRLNFDYLSGEVRREIEQQQTPLGRVLIDHDVLRQVQLVALWKVTPAAELRQLLQLPAAATAYGRTALIYCNGEPAVELLEIVTPD